MQYGTARENPSSAQPADASRIALTRLAIGLLQGAALFLLIGLDGDNSYFRPLLLILFLVPVLLVSSLGHLQAGRLVLWIGVATAIVAALALYDIWRISVPGEPGALEGRSGKTPSAQLIFFSCAGFFIAQALIRAGAADRRWIAQYSTYFETAWKLAIQIKFSMLFVGVLWIVLWLGALLFSLVGLHFLRELMGEPWFFIPVTTSAFAIALHITDVRPSLIRGIRTLLLGLMSWLLPLTTLIVAGFVLSLPFTGLEPLWATRHATAVLLGTSAALIVFINAAFQDGHPELRVSRMLRASASLASLLLAPLMLIGAYSLTLRVQQYGWTVDRIIAASCLTLSAVYACGYAWAALGRGAWLRRIAPVNVSAAFVVLALLLGLFSPLADPARLSVRSQVERLESGKASVENFDFDYLKFNGARYGREALLSMKSAADGPDAATIRQRAEAALKNEGRWNAKLGQHSVSGASDLAANISVMNKSKQLPDSFVKQNWSETRERPYLLPDCLTFRDRKCEAYLVDFSGDGQDEVLLTRDSRHGGGTIFALGANGSWAVSGTISLSPNCTEVWNALAAGDYRAAPPSHRDLEIAGYRLQVAPAYGSHLDCKPEKQ